MAKIEIEWTHDDTDCETCGSSWAEGATVKINGEVVLNFEPIAACYDGASYNKEQVYAGIMQHLGHELIETDQPYEPSNYGDDDYDDEE